MHGSREALGLFRDLFLLISRKSRKLIKFGADQEGYRCLPRDVRRSQVCGRLHTHLVESPRLPVPLLDGIQCALPRQVKHEENRHRIVAYKREHVHKLALAAKIPY